MKQETRLNFIGDYNIYIHTYIFFFTLQNENNCRFNNLKNSFYFSVFLPMHTLNNYGYNIIYVHDYMTG